MHQTGACEPRSQSGDQRGRSPPSHRPGSLHRVRVGAGDEPKCMASCPTDGSIAKDPSQCRDARAAPGEALERPTVPVMGGAALRAPRGRTQGGATTAIREIAEERQRSERPRAAATRRAHGGCGRMRRRSSGPMSRIGPLLPPGLRLASPMRATPPITGTGSGRVRLRARRTRRSSRCRRTRRTGRG